MPNHPHLKAVGLFQKLDHPTEGATITVRPPTLFSRTPAQVYRAAPQLGQHSVECLTEAGLSPADLERLERSGVLKQYKGAAYCSAS